MANESEGVLDVLREWRDMVCYSKGPVHPLCHGAIMNNLDRIEAAWKRERAEVEADALEVGGIVEAARTDEKSSAVGNAAAMSEAMNQVLFYAQYGIQYASLNPGDKECGGYLKRIENIARSALKFDESEVAR